MLIQELFGDQTHNWEIRKGYEGTPFIWCCIDNFGERPGLFGNLQRFADETYRARNGEFGRLMQGVGIMPEGIDNNPVAYDLVLELGWRSGHVDAAQWLEGYVAYRYGRPDPDLSAAWALLLQTAYGKDSGAPENVLCSRPQLPARAVSTWGGLKIGYDPAVFARAVGLFERAADRFTDSETYRLDRVALRVQALSNEAQGVSTDLAAALARKDRVSFDSAADRFLRLGDATGKVLDTEPFYRLATYQAQALRYGDTPQERRNSLRNAMMLVTYWGGDNRSSDDDNDYAYKTWAGMMAPYYLRRWQMYFDYQRALWDGKSAQAPDFYAWERKWVVDECAAVGARAR